MLGLVVALLGYVMKNQTKLIKFYIMSRSYPIWHQVQNCSYKSNKSYGNRNYGKETIFVGSSKNNSHLQCVIEHKREFGKIKMSTKNLHTGEEITDHKKIVIFKTYFDGKLMVEQKFLCDQNNVAQGDPI